MLMRMTMAVSFASRLKGLLQTDKLSEGAQQGVLCLAPCRSIHTMGMKQPVDVAFVNSEGVVVRVERDVKPGRLLVCVHARWVCERVSRPRDAWFAPGGRVWLAALETQEGEESR